MQTQQIHQQKRRKRNVSPPVLTRQEDLDRGSVTIFTVAFGYGPERDDFEEERSIAEAETTSSVTLPQQPAVLVSEPNIDLAW